ncbi:MAG: Maf family protein [Alphaproteobacteria bacterium]|nr:Maf family protein [Alphaproteobacteria bacterium]
MTDALMGPSVSETPLILASGSTTRADILRKAGLRFEIERPDVDEAAIRLSMIDKDASVEAAAVLLAEKKAVQISSGTRPAALVIGADQILECDGEWFEKPDSIARARLQLSRLSGTSHRLISSVVVALNGTVIWCHTDQARLTMRSLGDEFLESYIEVMGEKLFASVGAYQLEGLGAQLFSSVEGDHYTVLGLPLLPLVEFLRQQNILGK